MQIDEKIVAETSARLEGKFGPSLPPTAVTPLAEDVLPPDRIARVARYINERRAPDDIAAFERAMGTNDLLSLHYFWAGLRAARSVGCIKIPPAPGERAGSATGFMIAPRLLLTNWHVFKKQETASRSRIQFAYETDADGNERVSTWFSFAPASFFLTVEALDYCVVAVNPDSRQGPGELDSFGWLRLNPQLGKADYGQFLSIIQHPGGESKQVACRENRLYPFEDRDPYLTYQSDTFRGSSGSPVFNDMWDVVALHHSGKPMLDAQGHYVGHDGRPIVDRRPREDEIKWLSNEGIRTSKIIADILAHAPAGDERQTLEASFRGEIEPASVPLEAELNTDSHITAVSSPLLKVSDALPRAAEHGFVAVLPLNVSLRVENLDRPVRSDAARSSLPSPAVAANGRARDEALLEKLEFDTDYSNRPGYDGNFLGRDRPALMPQIDPRSKDKIAPKKRGRSSVLHYHHFSVVMHKARRMPVFAAWNTDYSKDVRKLAGREKFGKDKWIIDNRMDEKYQIPKGFYDRWKMLDYGHLVRRDDNAWGASEPELIFANSDTFHLTNCTPQHEEFNRDMFGYHGVWGRLENHIAAEARGQDVCRLSIFSGPFFSTKDWKLEDEEAGNVYVPLSFWKVVVAPAPDGGVRVFGFVTSQEQDLENGRPFTEFSAEGFEDEQRSLADIERDSIVRFDDALKAADVMLSNPAGTSSKRIDDVSELWMGRK